MTSEAASTARGTGRGILLGGAAAGLGDITYAILWNGWRGKPPLWTLQSVASGLFGEAAFDGGLATGAAGLLAHFIIATGAAATYALVARRVGLLDRRPVVGGLLFGPLVYLFMNFVVIPASAFPFRLRYPPAVLARGFVSHALVVGLPIALARRRARQRQRA